MNRWKDADGNPDWDAYVAEGDELAEGELRLISSDPLTDDSRWTLTGSRFDVDWDSYEALGRMIDEQMEQLPVDDPTRLLWNALPKARRPT